MKDLAGQGIILHSAYIIITHIRYIYAYTFEYTCAELSNNL